MKQAIDHKGVKYRSFKAMCEAYGQIPNVVRYRLRKGMSVEDALRGREVVDHLGNVYPSVEAMCAHYNKNAKLYRDRVDRLGWSVKDALTTPARERSENHVQDEIIDHKGNSFPTIEALCRKYNMSTERFRKRYYIYGWSMEKSLTEPIRKYKRKPPEPLFAHSFSIPEEFFDTQDVVGADPLLSLFLMADTLKNQ